MIFVLHLLCISGIYIYIPEIHTFSLSLSLSLYIYIYRYRYRYRYIFHFKTHYKTLHFKTHFLLYIEIWSYKWLELVNRFFPKMVQLIPLCLRV